MNGLKREKHLFEEAPMAEAILSLAMPAVMGQIILVIYNMADTFFVGLTGSDAMITAVTVCMPAFMFLSAIANLFGVGGASVIARALGNKNVDRARDTASFAFWGCLIAAAVYSIGAYLFRDTFVNLLGGSDSQVHRHAVEYLLCTVVAGGVVTSMNTLLAHLIRSEGRSLQSSTGIAIGGVLNIALDPLFMFVILPAGRETLGAALATALSNVATLIYFIIVIGKNRPHTALYFAPRRAMLAAAIPSDVLSTGIPACLMTLCENISYGVLDNLMALSGTAAQAGIGVAKKVNMLAHCMVRGMAQGVLPLIAYNYAAGDYKRMRSAVLTSTAISACLAGLCTAINLCFAHAHKRIHQGRRVHGLRHEIPPHTLHRRALLRLRLCLHILLPGHRPRHAFAGAGVAQEGHTGYTPYVHTQGRVPGIRHSLGYPRSGYNLLHSGYRYLRGIHGPL